MSGPAGATAPEQGRSSVSPGRIARRRRSAFEVEAAEPHERVGLRRDRRSMSRALCHAPSFFGSAAGSARSVAGRPAPSAARFRRCPRSVRGSADGRSRSRARAARCGSARASGAVAAIRDDVGQHVFGEEGGDCLCDARGEFGIETAGGFRLHDGVSCMPKIVAATATAFDGRDTGNRALPLLHLLRPQAATMHRIQYHFAWESIMKKLPQCVSSPVRLPWQAGVRAWPRRWRRHRRVDRRRGARRDRDVRDESARRVSGAGLSAADVRPRISSLRIRPTSRRSRDDGPNYCYDRYQRAYVRRARLGRLRATGRLVSRLTREA